MMIAELITVATEVLLGNKLNSTAAFLSQKCIEMGFSCCHQSIVREEEDALFDTLKIAFERADIILIVNAAGNAKEEITKKAVNRLLEKPMQNTRIIIEEKGKHIIMLPEPLEELKALFEKDVKDYLSKLESMKVYSQTVKTCGISMERAKELTLDLVEEQTNPMLSFMEKPSEVYVRVLAKEENEKEAKKIVKPYIKELGVRFGENLYTTEDITLEESVVQLLRDREFSVATAESCTGGLLAGRLINVAGVSEVFKTGYITYSNKTKRKILGVKKTTLVKHGAVSPETAREMAKGLFTLTKAEVTVSVTGIAGPDGGSPEKPVGLVYIACSVCGKITVKECRMQGNREAVRETTVAEALILIRKCILEYKPEEQR